MKYEATNYYGFDHKKVGKMFEGKLTYLGDVVLRGEDRPVAVYKSAKPNKKKGHKKYMLLQTVPTFDGKLQGVVRGMDPKDMMAHRHLVGLRCLECDKILVSLATHDYVSCGCENKAFADGGSRYFRHGAKAMHKTETVVVDALTGLWETQD